MGCDIHLHIEVKLVGDSTWEHYGMPRVPRSYALFAHMAGVRNEYLNVAPIAAPRGLPSDVSRLTAFDFERWKGDAHSASWASSAELVDLRDRMKLEDPRWLEAEALGGYVFGNYPSDFASDPTAGVDDLRFVFWFDN